MLETKNIFVTGGAGTLGKAIARRRKELGWTGKLTVYSTDEVKHARMRKQYPDVNYVQGDIRNPETLYLAMVGHDIVIHAAATKVIPVGEWFSMDVIDVGVNGSQIVCSTAVRAGIEKVIGISTDKACHPANLYGATKYAMEKIFQEYSRAGLDTSFHLVRYGNVLESTESVLVYWKQQVENGEPIRMTDPEMTRFWLSPARAAYFVDLTLGATASGHILIPKLPALSMGRMAEYIGAQDIERVPIRPGEKMHECLLTVEESPYVVEINKEYMILSPTTAYRHSSDLLPYTSDKAPVITRDELFAMLGE